MRKQTKKVLSWILAGAMALSLIPSVGLVSEKADAAVSTVDKVVFMKSLRVSRLKLLALNIVCRTACSLYLSSVRHQLIFN